MESIDIFLPVRKGSERILNKNTRKFADLNGGILELKLSQLLNTQKVNNIILSTNDEASVQIAKRLDPNGSKVKVIERPEDLCRSDTPLIKLIQYVPSVVQSNHIMWAHVTTPFVNSVDYDKAVETYFAKLKEGYDSLISVTVLKNFLFSSETKRPLNWDMDQSNWPRTQDLAPIYEVSHGIFLTSRNCYLQYGNRIGRVPAFYEISKLKSMDIDWEEDFIIAEAVYEKLFAPN